MTDGKQPQPGLTVALLAGGRSSRMGVDKAGVALAGRTLGERAWALARALSDDVVILGHGRGMPDAAVAGARRIDDPAPDLGPLGGLAALARIDTRLHVLVVPIDMPALTSAALLPLLEAVERAQLVHFEGSPLPFAITRATLAALPVSGSLHAAFASVPATTVPAPIADLLENVNDSNDLNRASRRPPFL